MPGSSDPDPLVHARLAALVSAPPSPPWVPAQPEEVAATRPEVPVAAAGAAAPPAPTPVLAVLRRLGLADTGDALLTAAGRGALGWLAAVCLGCVAVTAWVLLGHHRPAGGGPAPGYPPPSAPAAAASPSSPGIVVDVGGRVRHPGLVTLPLGARVADAVRAAGGALRPGDLRLQNLAARVSDGQLLLIGVASAPGGAGAGTGGGPDAPVSLSAASLEQLEALPGVGPVLAQHIIDYRQQHGGFTDVAQLQDVPGIGTAKFGQLQPLVQP